MEATIGDLLVILMKFLTTNNLEIVLVLFLLGWVIKHKTKINDSLILLILFVTSIVLMVLRGISYGELESAYTLITQSIYCEGAAVLINEAPKQMKKLFGITISNRNGNTP